MSKEANLTFRRSYSGSTSNVMKTVILGKADAGATLDVDLNKESEEISSQLRVILTTPKRASHPLTAHPRVPLKDRDGIVHAVLRLGRDAANAELLRSVRLPDPAAADYDRDYKDLEEIDIKQLIAE